VRTCVCASVDNGVLPQPVLSRVNTHPHTLLICTNTHADVHTHTQTHTHTDTHTDTHRDTHTTQAPSSHTKTHKQSRLSIERSRRDSPLYTDSALALVALAAAATFAKDVDVEAPKPAIASLASNGSLVDTLVQDVFGGTAEDADVDVDTIDEGKKGDEGSEEGTDSSTEGAQPRGGDAQPIKHFPTDTAADVAEMLNIAAVPFPPVNAANCTNHHHHY